MDRKLVNLKCFCAALCLGSLAVQLPLALAQSENRVLAQYKREGSQAEAAPRSIEPLQFDQQVTPASAQETQPARMATKPENPRLLAPRSKQAGNVPSAGQSVRPSAAPKFALPKIESFTTAGAGLAIVVGLFLVCMWLLKGATPKPTSPLPGDAVRVLGRIPLAARNFAHLLQVGHKLVLVAITPEGVAPITEITDPAEVQRLLGLCIQNDKHSTSAEFRDVLKHLTQEPAKGFLGNEAIRA